MVSSQRLKVAEAKFDRNITRTRATNAKDKVRWGLWVVRELAFVLRDGFAGE